MVVGLGVGIATLALFWYTLVRQDRMWDKYMGRDDSDSDNGGIHV